MPLSDATLQLPGAQTIGLHLSSFPGVVRERDQASAANNISQPVPSLGVSNRLRLFEAVVIRSCQFTRF